MRSVGFKAYYMAELLAKLFPDDIKGTSVATGALTQRGLLIDFMAALWGDSKKINPGTRRKGTPCGRCSKGPRSARTGAKPPSLSSPFSTVTIAESGGVSDVWCE
jgi:hypothetical protein